ncbi:hypothetical protein ACQP3F_33770, partial [Escherichia coli]
MEDWFLVKHHLREWKLICKNQEEKTSDLQSQQKVRAGRQVRLGQVTIVHLTACLPIHPPVLSA